jgi:hypothetical protein
MSGRVALAEDGYSLNLPVDLGPTGLQKLPSYAEKRAVADSQFSPHNEDARCVSIKPSNDPASIALRWRWSRAAPRHLTERSQRRRRSPAVQPGRHKKCHTIEALSPHYS